MLVANASYSNNNNLNHFASQVSSGCKQLGAHLIPKALWCGVGAASNYLSGGTVLGGAAFFPLTTEIHNGLFGISHEIAKRVLKNEKCGPVLASTLEFGTKIASMAIAAPIVHYCLEEEVTKTSFAVNLLPQIVGLGALAAMITIFSRMNKEEKIEAMKELNCFPQETMSPEDEKVAQAAQYLKSLTKSNETH